jgi:hypothetical protein
MTPQQPINPQQAPKKKMSGCLIALLVAGALAGLVCIVSSVALWMAARSESGKKIFSAIDQGVKLAQDGMNAPGAAELRAAGCPEALVMDMKAAMAIADTFVDGGLGEDAEMDYLSVNCSAPAGSKATLPTCDELAPIYAQAAPSERDFVVEVKRQGKQKPECQKRYSGDGEFISEVK